ncbi:heterokaryon incompatibility protein [Phlyctema vagabunda]|uniref:Heterokaryon incompatibility protein n=1 Tax=Phlyctema vagabunda TaxID=108571 RepID=A0ABR4PCA9_9HELO
MDKHSYVSLPSSGYLRILEVFPGPRDTPIKCRLHQSMLDRAPPFEALSYVWGSSLIKKRISCDGKPFDIRTSLLSLYDALGRLRYVGDGRSRYIWADAICINQEDLEERESKVQIMRKIYERAEEVIIWLGQDPHGHADLAFEHVKTIAKKCYTLSGMDSGSLYLKNPRHEIDDKIGDEVEKVLLAYPQSWLALQTLFEREWFSRGNAMIDFNDITVAASWVDWSTAKKGKVKPANVKISQGVNNAVLMRGTHIDVIQETRFSALLGFCNSGTEGLRIRPDYKKAVSDVIKDVVWELLQQDGGIDVLSLVQHGPTVPDDVPSWIPSLQVDNDPYILIWYPFFEASAKISDSMKRNEADHIALSGIKIRVVAVVSDVVETTAIALDSWQRIHTILTSWWNMLSEEEQAKGVYPNGESYQIAFCMSVTAGLRQQNYRGLSPQHVLEDYKAFMQMLIVAKHENGAESLTDAKCITGDGQRYQHAALRASHDHQFFSTSNGYVGVGPQALKRDDQIWILFGGQAPFVLRWQGENTFDLLVNAISRELRSVRFNVGITTNWW